MMKILAELREFYNTTLLPELQALEAQRKEVILFCRAVMFGAVMGWAGVLLLAIIATVIRKQWIWVPVLWCFLSTPVLAVLVALLVHSQKKAFAKAFKRAILPKITSFVDDRLEYTNSIYLTQTTLMASHIPIGGFYRTHPCFSGEVGSTTIEFSDIDLFGTEYPQIPRWRFFVADFPKSFTGTTLVFPDVAEKSFGRFGKKMQAMSASVRRQQLITLEDPEFERHFVVYGDDQIQARYILSPAFMRRLVESTQATQYSLWLSFFGSKVIGAFACPRTLQLRFTESLVRFDFIKEYVDYLQFALGIVEVLNLNTRIWDKQPVSSVDEGIMQIIKTYQARIDDTAIHFHPLIPEKMLKNALNSYASDCKKSETPLVLIDDTALESAKAGCLITDQRIYSQTYTEKRHLKLSELGNIRFRGYVISKVIFSGPDKILEVAIPNRKTVQLMTKMLQEMARYIHESRGDASMVKIIDDYKGQIQDNMIFFSPDIPKRKLNNACRRYASHYSPQTENALVLIDETTDGSATEGCLITDRHIYSHTFGKKRVSLSKLSNVRFRAESGTNNMILLNKRLKLSFPWLPKTSVQHIAEMLQEMVNSGKKGKGEQKKI